MWFNAWNETAPETGFLRVGLGSQETSQRSARAKIAAPCPDEIEDTTEAVVVVLSDGEARLGSTTCMPDEVNNTRRTCPRGPMEGMGLPFNTMDSPPAFPTSNWTDSSASIELWSPRRNVFSQIRLPSAVARTQTFSITRRFT